MRKVSLLWALIVCLPMVMMARVESSEEEVEVDKVPNERHEDVEDAFESEEEESERGSKQLFKFQPLGLIGYDRLIRQKDVGSSSSSSSSSSSNLRRNTGSTGLLRGGGRGGGNGGSSSLLDSDPDLKRLFQLATAAAGANGNNGGSRNANSGTGSNRYGNRNQLIVGQTVNRQANSGNRNSNSNGYDGYVLLGRPQLVADQQQQQRFQGQQQSSGSYQAMRQQQVLDNRLQFLNNNRGLQALRDAANSIRSQSTTQAESNGNSDSCCLFLFFDGSAHFFDEYLRRLTGVYRLMFGLVNGFPHYVARNCNEPQRYQKECSYIWNTGNGWVIGVGSFVGDTKGAVYTESESRCPSHVVDNSWRYLGEDLEWKDNGNIAVTCVA